VRRVRRTLIIGALVCATTLTAFSFVEQLYLWDSKRFVFAAGLAVLFTSFTSSVAAWIAINEGAGFAL
jgi:hypothetical protein